MSGAVNARSARSVLAIAAAATLMLTATSGTASGVTHSATLGEATVRKVAELTVPGSDELGIDVALSGNGKVAVLSSAAQEVFVFKKVGRAWTQAAQLTASDGTTGDGFGAAVAVSCDGSTILVGAPEHDDSTGAVYVFTRSGGGWQQSAELTASDQVGSGVFGWSVSVSGDGSIALVGAVGQGIGGQAYAFNRSGGAWVQTAVLSPADLHVGDDFGERVALSGDGSTAVVSAVFHGREEEGPGAAYVFDVGDAGWTQTAELSPADGVDDDDFGSSVAVSRSGSVAVVGADGHHKGFGAAYVYARRGGRYAQSAELTAADGSGYDFFGLSVAVNAKGSAIMVGAPLHHHQAGAAYVYTERAGAWSQQAELVSTRRREPNWFGYSTDVSNDGSTLLVGAFVRDANAGSAFVFTR